MNSSTNIKNMFAAVLWVLAWFVACAAAYANPPLESSSKGSYMPITFEDGKNDEGAFLTPHLALILSIWRRVK